VSIIKLRNVRIAFPHLFEKSVFPGKKEEEAKYNAVFLIPKDDPQVAAVKAIIQTVSVDRWQNKAEAILKELATADRICLRDGDNKNKDGYQGCMYINASNELRPKVLNRDKSELTKDSGVIYAGCCVVCSLDIWAQDSPKHPEYGKRINATLRGVQFMQDGDAFTGGGPVKDDEFDDLADTGEADGLT
jgi:hypothetical protein